MKPHPVFGMDSSSSVIVKFDGTINLCGNYKVTINKICKTAKYPLLSNGDIFVTLVGGNLFAKIDLSQAYLQVNIDIESQKYPAKS
jgi:hypothetical protein